MKYLLILVVVFASCGNKKADLVEELKQAKREYLMTKSNRFDAKYDNKDADLTLYDDTLQHLQYKVDSIEMELRKY